MEQRDDCSQEFNKRYLMTVSELMTDMSRARCAEVI